MTKLRIASIAVALVAAVLLGRMLVFLVDEEQTHLSIQPSNPWRTAHSCLTAYAEAARFSAEDRNIYEASLYEERKINGLKVDTYHYPPPFLLVPDAMQRVTGGYLALRAPWFLLQLALLGVATWLIARWLGGDMRRRVLLAAPLFFVSPTLLFTLQMGNFQSTTFALSVMGMIGLTSSRAPWQALGGVSLAYATVSKVFPGILIVYLIITRRWRALAWTAGAGIVLTLIALAVYGLRPFEDFISYQLPRLANGEAFPQSEYPRLGAANMSFYGLLVKLRKLGLDVFDMETGLAINSVYGVAVLALAAAVTWRRREWLARASARTDELVLWFALLNLASYRSPFVGGAYGLFGTVWLSAIMIGAATTTRARIGWSATFASMVVYSLVLPTPAVPPSQGLIAFSAAMQAFMIAVNVWICVVALLRPTRPMLPA